MYKLTNDVIGSYNYYINYIKQQRIKGSVVNVSLSKFNSQNYFVYKQKPIDTVQQLTQNDYIPNGGTSLYDAIGEGIQFLDQIEAQHKNDVRIFVQIITDGISNSDKKFNQNQIKQMIEERQKKGWDFIFAGSNIDSQKLGKQIGIKEENIAQISNQADGQKKIYKGFARRFKDIQKTKKGDHTKIKKLQMYYEQDIEFDEPDTGIL